jgi:polysaccharide transporter, PST family
MKNKKQDSLRQSLLFLYGVQAVNIVLPLVVMPYLAQILKVEGIGALAVVQSLAQYLSLVIEYGFNLSGTRQIALHRGNTIKQAVILSGIVGAKTALSMVVVLLSCFVFWSFPNLIQDSALFFSGIFWSIAFGFSPLWFFQGLEKMRFVAILEITTKIFATVLVFFYVKDSSDGWKVLFLQASASAIGSVFGLMIAFREVGFVIPNLKRILYSLSEGWSMFLFRAAVSLYTVGNTFLLGVFVPISLVAYYSVAERLTKACLIFVEPASRVFFSKLSSLGKSSLPQAAALSKMIILVLGLTGVLVASLLFVFAPVLVQFLFGHGFTPSIPLVRILTLLIPLVALSNALGIQWLLVLGLDKPFNTIILISGVVNLILVLVLVPRLQAIGMAIAVVSVECGVLLMMVLYLLRIGKTPWQIKGG